MTAGSVRSKRWREKNREKYLDGQRKYRALNRDRRNAKKREVYAANPETSKAATKKWCARNRKHRSEYMRDYLKVYHPLYQNRHRDRLRKYKSVYESNRRKTSKPYLLLHTLRKQLNAVLRLRDSLKLCSTRELVGCDLGFLIKHIESQFREGMTWENYGRFGWHIDDIIPCCNFNFSDPEQQRRCFHYSNLQPLWAKENLAKAKYIQ